MHRRDLGAGALAGALLLNSLADVRRVCAARADQPPNETASDEAFWFSVRQAYAFDTAYVLLNGNANQPVPRVVGETQLRHIQLVNASPHVNTFRSGLAAEARTARQRLARLAGCSAAEIALTRNTTEGLATIVAGMPLKAGDEVVTTSSDYPVTLNGLKQRAARDGVVVKVIDLPLPARSAGQLVGAFEQAIGPNTRAVITSHILDGPGQIMPIAAIAAICRRHGAQLAVDGALAFGQIPVDLTALGCDYYATSLHKWLSAPLGTGFLYVRRPLIAGCWPLFPAPEGLRDDISKFEQIGTHSYAEVAAVAAAADFYETLGPARKAARLQYLKTYWTQRLADEPRVRLGVSTAAEHSCSGVQMAIDGIDGADLSKWLIDTRRIFAWGPVRAGGLSGIDVAANVFTRLSELDVFVEAVRQAARNGLV